MISSADVRARRPQHHEPLITELQDEGGFPALRDVLLFGAAVGFVQKRRVPFPSGGKDPIRYDVLVGQPFADTLVSMIATSEVADDPEILDATRLQERVKIFEEYANGGLEYIQELVNTRRQPAAQIVLDLVTSALADNSGPPDLDVEDLLGGTTW